ncbi:MAG: methionine--tRNA ligase [Promethearchaeota archaeon]
MEIDYKEFSSLDIRVGLVKECKKVEKSKNLYKMSVDCGDVGVRQIITGISNYYSIEQLLNRKIIVLVNLKPKMIMGLESKGMLLAADVNNEPFLLKIDEKKGKSVPPGTKIK